MGPGPGHVRYYVCMYVCMYVYVTLYVYVYVYVYPGTLVPWSPGPDLRTGSRVGTRGLISVPASEPDPPLRIKKTSRRFDESVGRVIGVYKLPICCYVSNWFVYVL